LIENVNIFCQNGPFPLAVYFVLGQVADVLVLDTRLVSNQVPKDDDLMRWTAGLEVALRE
jgi:hypothetical protein